jgi:hypothetical protein
MRRQEEAVIRGRGNVEEEAAEEEEAAAARGSSNQSHRLENARHGNIRDDDADDKTIENP